MTNLSASLFRDIFNASFDGLWICDAKGEVITINKASEKIWEIKAENVVGRNMREAVEQGRITCSVTLEVIKNLTAVTTIQQAPNGRQILVTGNPVFNSANELELVVTNERDITALFSLRDQLDESHALVSRYRSELSLIAKQKDLLSLIKSRSKEMCRVYDTALRVAQVDSTVLIQGESGVGKGYIAKFIHDNSLRKNGPFVRVDCGALPEPLVESELFGYDQGAFTGAHNKGKSGHFEIADGGTLFLDEIGDLPSKIQVKLLRFLETNEIVHLGGTKTKKINVRMIAATHRNLKEMEKRGEFRSDLIFRLNVVSIHIPPLRDRPEDIPPLVEFFRNRLNKKYSVNKTIDKKVIDVLFKYEFPGNIRELSNIVEQIFVLSPKDRITLEDVPSNLLITSPLSKHSSERDSWNLERAVQNVEKKMIIDAMKSRGTQRGAASLLGVNQSTLSRKAKRLGVRIDTIIHNDA